MYTGSQASTHVAQVWSATQEDIGIGTSICPAQEGVRFLPALGEEGTSQSVGWEPSMVLPMPILIES